MSEFIREVDEEYRRERILAIWRRYSGVIVAIAILVIAGIGGWRYWQHRQEQEAQAAAIRFQDAVQLALDGKAEEAGKAFEAVGQDAPGGYRMLARFRQAAETARTNSADGAKAFDALSGDGSLTGGLQDLARLRGAMLRLDTAEAGQGVQALERLATPTGAWRHTAREFLGLSAIKRGEYESAGKWFDQIAADRDTPQGLRARLEIYSGLVAGGAVQTQ